jgi:hypothetical protein
LKKSTREKLAKLQIISEWYLDFLNTKENDKDKPNSNQYKIKKGIDYNKKRFIFK